MQEKAKRPTLKQYLKTRKIDQQIRAQGLKFDQMTVLTSESKAFNEKFKQIKMIIRNYVKDTYEYAIIDQKMDELKEMAFGAISIPCQSFEDRKSTIPKSETNDTQNQFMVKIPTKQPKKSNFNKENQKPLILSKTVGNFRKERPSIIKAQHGSTWQNFQHKISQPRNVKFSNTQKTNF